MPDRSESKRATPNALQVPANSILAIADADEFDHLPDQLIRPLKGNFRREWLSEHAYRCLPMVIGSQLGFVVNLLYDITVRWNGDPDPSGVTVTLEEADKHLHALQTVTSRFGMGTVTIQNRWTLRTEPGINLLTLAPPNFWIDGISHLVAAVETDNLRRDFTLNLKVTRPDYDVVIRQGTPVACLLPYPRHFVDTFRLVNASGNLPSEVISEERRASQLFGFERATIDTHRSHQVGRRYWKGEDVYGNQFEDHQVTLDDT